MVLIQTATPETPNPGYVVYEGGRQIGQIVEPRGDRVVGRGEGTVLLQR